jgi:hypothetical protein
MPPFSAFRPGQGAASRRQTGCRSRSVRKRSACRRREAEAHAAEKGRVRTLYRGIYLGKSAADAVNAIGAARQMHCS